MKKSSKLNKQSILKYSLSFVGIFLSTATLASEPENPDANLIQLHQNYSSAFNELQQPTLLAWGGRSRPEGVGGTRPANVPTWRDGTGTRPEGVEGTRPEGGGGTKPAEAPTWGDGTGTKPEGVGDSRPKWSWDN